MKAQHVIAAALCIVTLAQAQDMDKELSTLTESLAVKIKEHGAKKVAVIDFTGLDGGSSQLGRYIAEEMTVNFTITNRDFLVLDRANLKSILAEHKLTSQGLVDPENAKKLGQFAGVDAIILGNIVPLAQNNIELTAKVITTDTAQILTSARAKFKADESVQQLLSRTAGDGGQGGSGEATQDEKAQIVKTFGDLRVEIRSLKIVDGKDYLLSLNVTNINPRKTIYVALECEGPVPGALKSTVSDPEGFRFISYGEKVTGVSVGSSTFMGWNGAVKKILPKDSVSATIDFISQPFRAATPGQCHIQLTFLDVTLDGYGKITSITTRNLTCNLTAVAPGVPK